MADWKTTTVAPGVVRYDCDYFYDLTGTKEALLASGLAKEEWFWNGRRSANGRRLMTTRFYVNSNRAKCRPNYQSEGEYVIQIEYSNEEQEKRRQANEQAAQKELELERIEAHRVRMRKAVATPGGVRKKAGAFVEHANTLLFAAFNADGNPDNPWRFPTETIERARWHFGEILKLFEDGGFEVRAAAILQGNAEFERFMRLAQGDPSATPS